MDVDDLGSSSVALDSSESLTTPPSATMEIEEISNFVTAKDWTFDDILSRGVNFKAIPRVDVARKSLEDISKLVRKHEKDGIPLVMSNWHRRAGWEASIFQPAWLKKREGDIG
jgi:hypothetical protein